MNSIEKVEAGMDTGIDTSISEIDSRVNLITVDSQESFSEMESIISLAKSLNKEIKDFYDPHIKDANAVHKGLTKSRKEKLDPIKAVIDIGQKKLGDYHQRMRIAQQEAERLEHEEQKKLEAARLDVAEILEETQGTGAGEAYLASTEKIADDNIQKVDFKPSSNGGSVRTNWKFEISDISKIPIEYMVPDMVMIGGVVRAKKGDTNIPGINVFPETKHIVK